MKASLANNLENSHGLLESFICGPNNIDVDEILNAVDNVQANDVNVYVKRIGSSKHSLAAIGNLSELPRLEELRA